MATSNVAIIDDRNPLVHYVGEWTVAGSPAEFNGTTTFSATEGSTASFTFVGTSVTIYASVAAKEVPDASLNFMVDNIVSGTYTAPSGMASDIHHEALWTSPTLSNGSHILVITQTAAPASVFGVIYLDYLMYTTTTATSAGPYFIDDSDARIKYTPAWRQAGSDNDFQHTSRGSTSTGDSFSLQFEGTAISFHGAINNGSAGAVSNASIVIDEGPKVLFVPPIQTAAVTTNNLIFNSGDLSEGTHTLVVTAENDHTVWSDYFLVSPGTSPISTSSAPPTSSSSSVPPSSSSTHTTTFIGIAAGAVVLVALVAFALFFLRQRRRRRAGGVVELPLSNALIPFSDFESSGAPSIRPFGSNHAYSALSGSDTDYAGESRDPSFSGHSTTPLPASISIGKRAAREALRQNTSSGPSSASGSSQAGLADAPPQYSA
ncbi:hypothetical protein C8F04DRAFT_1007458 [Mycena alexandri]|uniref:Transmembrane protein n=1 Tax=Mycena alexandri TaxID=1745969 RepID=A0AAD6SJI0_9AGAR|nr:hypothetical protein C8F04DRAFT_1007458 [Mycena alexandri]